jgi:hypothetical protein
MTRLLLETEYDPPLDEQLHDRESERLDPCLQAHGARWIRSYLSRDRRRMICEFEADDAEGVRSAFRSAGVPFARAWVVDVFEPGGGAQGGWRERIRTRAAPAATAGSTPAAEKREG